MASRMDRYYQADEKKRTAKNHDLYKDIYDEKNYDNVEKNVSDISVDTIATLDSGKQIDINEVKALLEKRNEYKKTRQLVKEQPSINKSYKYDDTTDKVYDVRDLLEKAKKEDKKEEYRPRSLADTQVLTLQELITKKEYSKKSEINEDEMKDLINTIYSTNMLKSDSGDGLLDGLMSSGNTVVNPDIKEILKEKREEIENNTTDLQSNTGELDKSFYTSSLGFKKSDFVTDDQDEEEHSNKGLTIFLVLLGLVFVGAVVFIIYYYV